MDMQNCSVIELRQYRIPRHQVRDQEDHAARQHRHHGGGEQALGDVAGQRGICLSTACPGLKPAPSTPRPHASVTLPSSNCHPAAVSGKVFTDFRSPIS